MSKKFLLLTVLILPFFLTACTKKSEAPITIQEPEQTLVEPDTGRYNMTMLELMTLGKNYRCTFSHEQESTKLDGTVYVAGNRIRNETTGTMEDTTYEMTMISDGEWMYSWNNIMPDGMKMNIEELKNMAPETETDQSAASTATQKYDFDCDRWSVDESVFDLPTNVEFTDWTGFIKDMAEKAPQMEETLEDMQKQLEDYMPGN